MRLLFAKLCLEILIERTRSLKYLELFCDARCRSVSRRCRTRSASQTRRAARIIRIIIRIICRRGSSRAAAPRAAPGATSSRSQPADAQASRHPRENFGEFVDVSLAQFSLLRCVDCFEVFSRIGFIQHLLQKCVNKMSKL